MAALMRILGWKSEGLRCPDHEIKCYSTNGDLSSVTLIQMPNGTGKTTTLELLRGALSGSANNGKWDSDRVRGFRKRDGGNNDGYFEVRLLLNDRRVTIRMVFDFDNGRITYKTTRGAGQQDGFEPPREFGRFMDERFVNLYVFDGELAQRLLDRDYMDAESVVENLFQLNLFESLKYKVEQYWENQTQNVNAREERGFTRRTNKLKRLKSRYRGLKESIEALNNTRVAMNEELEKKELTYNTAIKNEEERAEKLQSVESEVERLSTQVRKDALDTLESMRDPHAITSEFARSMMQLKTSLDRVKLPESAAKEFFEELSEESECVCGRPINSEVKTVIRNRAEQYLGSEDVAFLNVLKRTIQEAIGVDIDEPGRLLDVRLSNLETAVQDERSALNDYEALRNEADQSDPSIKQAHEEINTLKESLAIIESELEKYDSDDESQPDDKTFGIEVLAKRISQAEDDLAEVTHTLDLKNKRDLLCKVLEDAHNKARRDIMKEICEEANNRIVELIPYNNITIDRIDQRLVLRGQEGGSVGETLSVAWAFLATLFHRSEYELPFIVDSPAGPIDLEVRPKIGELIPRLTKQFIAFTISSEREQFITALKQSSNDKVRFVTLFRKGSEDLEKSAKLTTSYEETEDGMKVVGESFFNSFQLDDEEAT